MTYTYCKPMVEVIRGSLLESIHFGALAIVDSSGNLIASYGDVEEILYLRSSSKPFQTLPLVEAGGVEAFHFTEKELAITCASHKGTDDHVAVLKSMHEKIGVTVDDLQCGVHPAGDRDTYDAMVLRGEEPNAYRHNCSGKHTGMLAQLTLNALDRENYVDVNHPLQQKIIQTFAEMAGMAKEDVVIGIDGCSVPVFGVPLWRAAYAYARLVDPVELNAQRASACRQITHAMMTYPEMVAGPKDSLDTALMQAGDRMVVSKGGADGFQALGVMPGAREEGSPGYGIAFKITDGDHSSRARGVASVETLRQMGVLSPEQIEALSEYAARPMYNVRKFQVGEIRPCFDLGLS
ncbi:MAG: asparaginase [Anaerolineaceae bacterium]|nr:asparaginase [Anaerolineaceae bacterium]